MQDESYTHITPACITELQSAQIVRISGRVFILFQMKEGPTPLDTLRRSKEGTKMREATSRFLTRALRGVK
jgi:hypothetical protein